MNPESKFYRLNALRIEQRKDIPIYVFGIEGRLIRQIAHISPAHRTEDGILTGYQRQGVVKHINEILAYLRSSEPLLPNAIVVAFSERVSFSAMPGITRSEWGSFGHLQIPIPRNGSEQKPCWIVDGQQRATALAQLDPTRPFPVVVVGFQASSESIQREQFLLVNKTKPLPKDLLHEILPEISAPLPKDLEKRQLASKVLKKLRFDKDSPFYRRVRGLDTDCEAATISQASLLSVIQNSIRQKGVLFYHYDSTGMNHNIREMALIVSVFYDGVRRTWPKAWDASPKSSRLVHGVGIVAMGYLMDRIMQEVDPHSVRAASMVENRLERIKTRCAWTSGRWPVLGCEWNILQNTSQDKARLTEYLLKEYTLRA